MARSLKPLPGQGRVVRQQGRYFQISEAPGLKLQLLSSRYPRSMPILMHFQANGLRIQRIATRLRPGKRPGLWHILKEY
jgi:hypothetical protein